jgi:predicted AAA+ superfamily ATPase
MIKRIIETEFRALLKEYPIITILGPRQAGKTTLAQMVLPDYAYQNLEIPHIREFASRDPQGFLEATGSPAILDEIQRVPELLSYLQGIVDTNPKLKAQYILTGSHQLELRAAISQSLAGRTALLHLLPLSIAELSPKQSEQPFSVLAHKGFLPRIYAEDLRSSQVYANYYQTYLERDVRQLIHLKDASLFDKFMRLLAGRTGQILNKHSLGNDVGVNAKTIDHWLSILEASFVVFKLPPYFENFGKRAIKSPKVFFYDVGLLVYLLGIHKPEQVSRDPLVGGIFENMVISECLKDERNHGRSPRLYYYQDNNRMEVDLIIDDARQLHGVEIKSASTPLPDQLSGLKAFHERVHPLATQSVVYSGPSRDYSDGSRHLHFLQTASLTSPQS